MKKSVLFAAVAAIVLAAVGFAAYWHFLAPHPHVAVKFQPTMDNGKFIRVRGWSDTELRKIAEDFCKAYDVPAAFDLVAAPDDAKLFALTFPGDIQPELFFFLVNYINYPKGYDLAGRSVAVLGRTTLTADMELPDERLVGKLASVYVPQGDTAYDLVYVRLESGDTYADSFTAGTWTRVEDPRVPPAVEALRNLGRRPPS